MILGVLQQQLAPAGGPTTIFEDTFTDTDNTASTSHTPDTGGAGGYDEIAGSFEIQSNTMVADTTSTNAHTVVDISHDAEDVWTLTMVGKYGRGVSSTGKWTGIVLWSDGVSVNNQVHFRPFGAAASTPDFRLYEGTSTVLETWTPSTITLDSTAGDFGENATCTTVITYNKDLGSNGGGLLTIEIDEQSVGTYDFTGTERTNWIVGRGYIGPFSHEQIDPGVAEWDSLKVETP